MFQLINRLFLFIVLAAAAMQAQAAPVLMISVDGLRPRDILEAKQRGLNVPVLSALVEHGAYATGVRNVLPTVTYPNHTTLITGTSPARHGIPNNVVFDPYRKNADGWYWYYEDIKVPTLWSAVHAKQGIVASISWPVTVGAPDIDYNIPEFWRAGTPDDRKLVRALSSKGLMARLEKSAHVSLENLMAVSPESDALIGKMASAMMADIKPRFTTIHFSSVDHSEHEKGPGSAEAIATIESLDGVIGDIIGKARKAQPDLVVAIVSDHGFLPVGTEVNLAAAFIDAGLITIDPNTKKATTWDAMPWAAGGSAAIVLARTNDEALKAKVSDLLTKLQANADLGIDQVIDSQGIANYGASPLAQFWVGFKPGFAATASLTAPATGPAKQKGTHGYFPDSLELRATFIIDGPGLKAKGSLGDIDMRDIAPTLAKILDVKLPSAEGKPLF